MAPLSAKKILIFTLLGAIFTLAGCESKENEAIPSPEDQQVSGLLYGGGEISLEQAEANLQYFFENQKYDDLLKENQKFRKKFEKEQARWDYYEGIALFGRGETEKARPFLKNAQSLFPGRVAYYFGHLARKEKNPAEAEKYYRQAYEDLKEPEILSSLADLFYESGKIDQAIALYEKALPDLPDSYMDRYFLAIAYFQKNQLDKTEKLLHEALAINGRFKKAYIGLASVAEKRGKEIDKLYYASRAYLLDQDYDNIIKILENRPVIEKDVRVYKFYLIALMRGGLTEKAVQVQNRGEKIFPSDEDLKMYRGMLLNMKGKEKEALEYFKALSARYPENFNILAAYGDLLLEDQKSEEARILYEKALQIDPSSTSYRYKLAEIYRKASRQDEELYHRGILYLYQGMILEARESLMRVKKPIHLDFYYFYLGKALEKDLPEEALKHFELAIKENPKMEKAYLEAAYLYLKKKEKEKALKLLSGYPGQNKEIEELKKFIAKW